MEKLIAKIKRAQERLVMSWKRMNQNMLLKKVITKDDRKYLSRNQIKEARTYWKSYTNKCNVDFIQYYSSKTGIFSKLYVPDNLYYSYIDMHFNNSKMSYGIDNKVYYDKLLPNVRKPFTILRRINGYYYDYDYNFVDSVDIKELFGFKNYVYKPAIDSSGGRGIIFFNMHDYKELELEKLLAHNDNYIIQEVVDQHKALSKLHSSSLNTIRVISLLFKGEVYILSSVLRMGVSGCKVDNASSGGLVVGIDENGQLKEYAYSSKGTAKYDSHPDTKISFKGYKIPNFEEIVRIVENEALNFPYFRLISWDFAIGEDGEIVFIEFNLKNGQLDFHQLTNGPLFGELTDEVLSEVFRRNKL